MTGGTLVPAPLFADLAEGPEGGEAFWLICEDGLRIRAGVWPVGAKGTVLLFSGRTEYVEKYGRAAADLAARGYATLTLDWRGQGLADRSLPDRVVGHVRHFDDYQQDVRAALALAQRLGLPQPYHLMAHSMGGCIGLRALLNGLPVRSVVFSAPMWGITMAAWMRPLARPFAQLSALIGQGHRFAPGTSAQTYVAEAGFGGNVLTTDPDMWRYMQRQVARHPELGLGGPSLEWVHAALTECLALAPLPSPRLPCVTALGTGEKVVDTAPIHLRMARWPGGRLDLYPGAEHEVLMEAPLHRIPYYDRAAALFDAAGGWSDGDPGEAVAQGG
jgi:lysophospholipase